MNRRAYLILPAVVASLTLLLFGICRPWRLAGPAEPQKLQDVIGRAERLGLQVVTTRPDGTLAEKSAVVICELSTTQEEACELPAGDLDSPKWRGRALVKKRVPGMVTNNAVTVEWGQFWVYGDPDLIRRLVK
jgi:hypothetical protein